MSLRKMWNETVAEGVPDEFQALLDKMTAPARGNGRGASNSSRGVSLNQPPVTQPHNLSRPVSTPCSESGSR